MSRTSKSVREELERKNPTIASPHRVRRATATKRRGAALTRISYTVLEYYFLVFGIHIACMAAAKLACTKSTLGVLSLANALH